jgi:hypothetical protein
METIMYQSYVAVNKRTGLALCFTREFEDKNPSLNSLKKAYINEANNLAKYLIEYLPGGVVDHLVAALTERSCSLLMVNKKQ